MQFKDYYKIMGVDEKATTQEIKKAYRKLARRFHPDVSKETDAEQKFKELGEAYEVLKDTEKRQEYDQLRAMGTVNQNGEFRPPPDWESAMKYSNSGSDDFSDFFENIFGRQGNFHRSYQPGQSGRTQSFSMRGEDQHFELTVSLEAAFAGTSQAIELRIPVVDEQGMVVHKNKKLNVKIPAGLTSGQQLRLKGQGAPGIGSGKPGDLILTIKVAPHSLYAVEGKNISLVLPLTPSEAALGTKVTVPTLTGKVKVSVPPLSQSGQKLRLKGKGLPGKVPGDFIATIKIVMPDKATDKSRELFTALAEELPFNPRAEWEK
tara:strand:- start:81519 stop:82475 length:957 start_codon:yes stop_codon:yes gene_type:complete